ncbi:MAG: penicillin-binding protein 1C [Chthoniobacterales bacterium]
MRRRWRIIAAVGAVASAIALIAFLPLPRELRSAPSGTLTLLDDRGRELAEIANSNARVQLPSSLAQMGKWLPMVTIALEDRRFREHHGIDWRATAAAAARDLRSHRVVSGGSTITQQLVKLATRRTGRGWVSKFSEAVAAWKLECTWSKERILAEYLNRSSYGNRRVGPEAAARAYFNKHAVDLTLAEAIYLAGLPQAPTRLNPWRRPEAANRRFARSLVRLHQLGVIDSDQRALFAAAPPLVQHTIPARLAGHFVDAVIARNQNASGTVRTTLDLDLQHSAERLLRSHLEALNRDDITQAALVVIDNSNGAVRALVGSSDYTIAQLNAAMRPRSCGSTLKPFVYLAALDRRLLTAATLLPDTADAIRDEYAGYDPQNFNHHYLGPVRVREALACSLNVPAVFTLSQLGARNAFHELSKWGFDFPRGLETYGAGFVLGNAETRLVDLAAAYAGLARGGVAMRAKFGANEHPPMTRVASPEASAIITDILCDNEAREKSFGTHSPLAFPARIAVKTGTSSGFRDAWTVGFNKQHTVGVWAGNFDGRPMRNALAIRAASPLWAAMMNELLNRDEPLDPPHASSILRRREICKTTGLLPSADSRSRANEWFLADTEPKQSSAELFENGKLVLPETYGAWCASGDNMIGARVRPSPRITNPPASSRYVIDAVLPPQQQMIELTTTLPPGSKWFVNDALQPAQNDGRVFWQLRRGDWQIRAANGQAVAEARISVE